MGFLHFSHSHLLYMDEVEPEGTAATVNCFGCGSPCSSGGPIFGCVQCDPRFVLHEECFLARRFVDHPLHPSHPLTLLPFPTYSKGSFFCNICKEPGSGFCWVCSKCEFDLHLKCAVNYMPSRQESLLPAQGAFNAFQPPKEVHHVPQHELSMTLKNFLCRACGQDLGDHNAIHCGECDIDVHFECAALLRLVKRKDHVHPFVLRESVGGLDLGSSFVCDVCHSDPPITNLWMYWCQECGIGCHVNCVSSSPCSGSIMPLLASSS